jgi:hypothetical protein
MEYLPHGDGWPPPGRPGATLGSWEATRGGKSSRWYIFPMEAAGEPSGWPGVALGSWEATRGGKSSRWYIFSMEAAGSRPAGLELPWEASGYQENREQTDVLSST